MRLLGKPGLRAARRTDFFFISPLPPPPGGGVPIVLPLIFYHIYLFCKMLCDEFNYLFVLLLINMLMYFSLLFKYSFIFSMD